MKKIILTYICCSVFLSSFLLQKAQAKEKIDYSQAVVYTSNEHGELVESDKSIEYFLDMLEDKSASTYAIPTPDYSSIRITDVHYSVADPETGAAIIDFTILLLGATVWGDFQSLLINAVTKNAIGKTLFDRGLSVTSSMVAISFSSKVSGKSYQTSYMYKTWSDYYDCYLVYFCLFDYSDSARTKIRSVYHQQVATESVKIGL